MTLTPLPSPEAHVQAVLGRAERVALPMAGGGQIVWHVWGQGTPLVLLHGGHGSWAHWIRNVLPLSEHFQVWAADLPGFGESDRYGEAGDADGIWPAVADSIRQRIATDGGGVHIAAFSFGSLVASFLAINHPELVRSFTLVGAAALFPSDQPLQGMASLRNLTEPAQIHAALRQNLGVLMLHNDSAIDDLAVYLQGWNVPRDRMPGRRLAFSQIQRTLQARWRCPVQGIWGRHDVLYNDARFAQLPEVLADCDLRGVHVIDHAGHWVQYEAPDAVNQHIRDFVHTLERETA